ncbi:hypothetical protein [Streptomyces sviceus]|uniref:hypothetical protein n=1 Tax=Streptomyces sviceus TaxID=285530 RepID=UPI00369A3875
MTVAAETAPPAAAQPPVLEACLSPTRAGAREARVVGEAWGAWLEERVERDLGRLSDTDLRAVVDTIAKRLLVEHLNNGLPQRTRELTGSTAA